MSSTLEFRYLDDGSVTDFVVTSYVADIYTAAGALVVADLVITELAQGRYRVTNPGTETGHHTLHVRESTANSLLIAPADYDLRNDGTAHYPVEIATFNRIGTPAGASITEDIAAVQAAIDVLPTLTEILAGGDIDGYTLEETLKLCLAALAGKLSGAGGTTITIRSADDSANRIVASVDVDGNRTAVILDATG